MYTCLMLLCLVLLVPRAFALQAPQQEAVVVGHLTYLKGTVLRFDHDREIWVPQVADSPVGPGDIIFAETGAGAEIIIPNNTWVRVGNDTRLEIVSLENDRSEIEITTSQCNR